MKYYNALPTDKMNPHLTDAIKNFQKAIGHPVTGVLLTGELLTLMQYTSKIRAPEFSILSSGLFEPYVYKDNYQADAEGTWVIEGNEKITYPIHTSKIECFKDTMTCTEVTAIQATLNDKTNNYHLTLERIKYKITKWDANEITADNTGVCRISTLMINGNTEKVFQIVRSVSSEYCDKHYQPLLKPRIISTEPPLKAAISS